MVMARVDFWVRGKEVLCMMYHQINRVHMRGKVNLAQKKLWNQIRRISMNVTKVMLLYGPL